MLADTKPTAAQSCYAEKPCLFDVISDESESHNLANQPEHAADVEHLAQRLASYSHYVDGSMTEEELEPYECVPHSLDNNSAHALAQDAWWGNFQGPCCTIPCIINLSRICFSSLPSAPN